MNEVVNSSQIMENPFHHRLAAKEARQQRVTRSLRNMEDEANELVAFLDDQRDRRRTINIMYGKGSDARSLQINTDDLTDDGSMLRFDSKGSLISKTGSPAASQQSLSSDSPTSTNVTTTSSVDIQNTRFSQTRERRRQQRQKQKEKETTDKSPEVIEDVATRLRKRLDQRKVIESPPVVESPRECPLVKSPRESPPAAPVPTPRTKITTPPRSKSPPPIPRRKSVGDLKKQFSVPLVQKELSTPTSDEDSGAAELNVNVFDLDELDEIIATSNNTSVEISPPRPTLLLEPVHSTPQTESICEPLESTPSSKTQTETVESEVIPSMPKLKSKIDLILSSTPDELDDIEIGPPPAKPTDNRPIKPPKPINVGNCENVENIQEPIETNTTTTTAAEPVAPTPELTDESLEEHVDDIIEPISDIKVTENDTQEALETKQPEPKEIKTEPVTLEKQLKQEPKQDEPKINNEVEAEQAPAKEPTNQKLSSKAAIYESDLASPVTPPPVKEMPQVGSINDRLSKYQSASSPVEDKREDQSANKPKVGKLSDRKDSYLKQANNSSSPSHAAPVRMASSGLTERMKLLEQSSKGGNLVRRETVNLGERASDIKSRINGWGKANTTDNVLH